MLTKKGWATVRATFSRTHLGTLIAMYRSGNEAARPGICPTEKQLNKEHYFANVWAAKVKKKQAHSININ
jgi:hypothetical protein